MLIEKALEQSQIDLAEVEIFLSHLLGKDRSFVQGFPEFKLNSRQIDKFKEFVKRRAKNEPLAYILGYREFCGINIKVDPRVMIPRPETEEIVNEVIKQVYAIPNRNRNNHWEYDQLTIVDVGTGSGNIAIALAKAIPFAKVFAVEKDKKAIKVAEKNIASHNLTEKIQLIQGDLLQPINEPIDIIATNLPYIPRSRFPSLEPEVRDWEPRIAFDGGEDGLVFYRQLFKQASEIIKPSGSIYYEVDGKTFIKNY